MCSLCVLQLKVEVCVSFNPSSKKRAHAKGLFDDALVVKIEVMQVSCCLDAAQLSSTPPAVKLALECAGLQVHTHTHTYAHLHARAHTRMCAHTHANAHALAHTKAHKHTHKVLCDLIHICEHARAHTRARTHTHARMSRGAPLCHGCALAPAALVHKHLTTQLRPEGLRLLD